MLGLAASVLWGIIAGGTVFLGTLSAVFFLLYHGGSFDRIKREAAGMPTTVGELKPQIYDKLLEKASTLSLKPKLNETLFGDIIFVQLLNKKKDLLKLFLASNGTARGGIYGEKEYDPNDIIWKYLAVGPFTSSEDFKAVYTKELSNQLHLTIFHVDTGLPIGMLSLSNNSPANLKIEISSMWLVPSFQNTTASAESVMLVLQYLFKMGYRRVEWRCDGHNVRARKAAHNFGFSFEGVLRKDSIVKKSNCDTVVFSVINNEWPTVRDHLLRKLRRKMPA